MLEEGGEPHRPQICPPLPVCPSPAARRGSGWVVVVAGDGLPAALLSDILTKGPAFPKPHRCEELVTPSVCSALLVA